MSSNSGSRTSEEGARVGAYLATLDKHFDAADRPTGRFFYDMKEIEF
jgi:hypothetical protein